MDIASTFEREPFRHSDAKYKCLCGRVHVKKGTIYIAIFCILAALAYLIGTLLDYDEQSWQAITIASVAFVVMVIGALTIFLAMKKEHELLLAPYLILMGICGLIGLGLVLCGIWSLVDPESGPIKDSFIHQTNSTIVDGADLSDHSGITLTSSLILVFGLVLIALCIWFAFVLIKFFHYLKDMKYARHPRNDVYHEVSTMKREAK